MSSARRRSRTAEARGDATGLIGSVHLVAPVHSSSRSGGPSQQLLRCYAADGRWCRTVGAPIVCRPLAISAGLWTSKVTDRRIAFHVCIDALDEKSSGESNTAPIGLFLSHFTR